MAYSDFTLQKLKKDFGLQVDEQRNLFAAVELVAGSELLNNTLQETVQLAIAINTEKARSEMIITPVLLEVRRQANGQVSLFSGTEFNVDEEKGLVGYCDYILSRSKEQLTINAPVIVIAEAKNENIKAGLGQCIAGMVAAQQFNQQEGQAIDVIYGAVTTGEIWKFLKLFNTTISIDLTDYYISPNLNKILGILIHGLGLPVHSSDSNEPLAEITEDTEIVITRGNTPIARLLPTDVDIVIRTSSKEALALQVKRGDNASSNALIRRPNLHLGAFAIGDDFDEPLPDSFWLGEA